MIIQTPLGTAFIEEEAIISMSIREEHRYMGDKTSRFFAVWIISENVQMPSEILFDDKESAEKALLEIHDKIPPKNVVFNATTPPDYIQGFKEGTEYAMKLEQGRIIYKGLKDE